MFKGSQVVFARNPGVTHSWLRTLVSIAAVLATAAGPVTHSSLAIPFLMLTVLVRDPTPIVARITSLGCSATGGSFWVSVYWLGPVCVPGVCWVVGCGRHRSRLLKAGLVAELLLLGLKLAPRQG